MSNLLGRDELLVLDAVKNNPFITTAEVAEDCRLSLRRTRRSLKVLVQDGLVAFTREKRKKLWVAEELL